MIKSVPGLRNHYAALPDQVRTYFGHVPALLDHVSLDVCLGYVFSRTEMAQNLALYCGLVKLHRAHGEVVWNLLLREHITRDGFRGFFKTIFGHKLPSSAVSTIQKAEMVRDQVMHGKGPGDPQLRDAIAHVLDYTNEFNTFVQSIAGIKPCGDLRGFKGSASPLDKSTTRWVLKGMGFSAS